DAMVMSSSSELRLPCIPPMCVFRRESHAEGREAEEEAWHPDPRALDTSVVRHGRRIGDERRGSWAPCLGRREEFRTAAAVDGTPYKPCVGSRAPRLVPGRRWHQASAFQNGPRTFASGLREARREERSDLCGIYPGEPRSEEHTSELQSLAYLVCRLLLEKKKNCTWAPKGATSWCNSQARTTSRSPRCSCSRSPKPSHDTILESEDHPVIRRRVQTAVAAC